MSTTADLIRAQFEVSEASSHLAGVASYRHPAADVEDVLLGHDRGYDHVAFLRPGSTDDWTSKTVVLDVGRSSIEGTSEEWLEGAYIVRYQSAHREQMLGFVADLIERTDRGDVVQSTDTIIEEWTDLWRRLRGPLSVAKRLGLFGELLVLERFVEGQGPGVVEGWLGPGGALHDFSFPHRRVEVKTTGYVDPVLHISSFNQLRPCNPDLHLVMVRVRPGGSLTLPGLVEQLRVVLAEDPDALDAFESRLSLMGYFDIHAAHYRRRYQEASFSALTIDETVDVLHEGRLDRPVAGLLDAKWSLDPATLPFAPIDREFWAG